MNAAQRREKILQQLHGASVPISASALAAKLGVSRQIVVGDVALLRAGGAEIEATPRGYQFHPTPAATPASWPVCTGLPMRCAPSFTRWWIREAWWSMWRWKTRFTANCGAT